MLTPLNPVALAPEHYDLAHRLTYDLDLKEALSVGFARMADIVPMRYKKPQEYLRVQQETMLATWAECGCNSSLLMPYFFPQYPKNRPMNMMERPFNMILLYTLVYHLTVLRGSRQIGKTVSMGTGQRVEVELLSNFRSMYIAPHSEPLKTYARKFREIEKAFRGPKIPSKFKQNDYYKEYPNGSSIDLCKVQTSATTVRGKTADRVRMDETVDRDSNIFVLEGKKVVIKKIFDMQVGMTTVDFDEGNQPRFDKITGVICKGKKHEWALRTLSGKVLRSTGSTRIKTNRGWYAMCEFISWEDAGRCEKTLLAKSTLSAASKLDPGYATWRRVHEFFEAAGRVVEGTLQGESQFEAGGILHRERGNALGLYQHTTKTNPQPWLWGDELRFLYTDNHRIGPVQGSVLHPESRTSWKVEKGSDSGLGGSADLGSHSMVVHGRWRSSGLQSCLPHTVVLSGRGGAVEGLVSPEGDRGKSDAGKAETRGALLDSSYHGLWSPKSFAKDETLSAGEHALQVGDADRGVEVRILQHGFSNGTLSFRSPKVYGSDSPVLFQSRLSCKEATTDQGTECSAHRRQRALQKTSGSSLPEPRKEEGLSGSQQRKTAHSLFRPELSRQEKGVEGGIQSETQTGGASREGRDGVDMSVLQKTLQEYLDPQGLSCFADHLLHGPGLSGEEKCIDASYAQQSSFREKETQVGMSVLRERIHKQFGTPFRPDVPVHLLQEGGLCQTTETGQKSYPEGEEGEHLKVLTIEGWEEIVDVSYHGFEEVWDIETERHHTFFADGIGVHNCQLFDPGLELETLEVMNDSEIKSLSYAGTSTTLDTLLELRFQEGTQGVWQIPLPDGGVINCGDPDSVIPYIGEYCMEDPKTRIPIDPLSGFYKFENPAGFADRVLSLHIPQIINPDICNKPEEWNGLYKTLKRDKTKFIQEKLGIPVAEADAEISKGDLQRICVLPFGLEERKKKCRDGYYKLIISGMDWGGSDQNVLTKAKISNTTHGILGVAPDDKVHILYYKRHGGKDYKTIINDIAIAHSTYCAGPLASDYGGGLVYNQILREHPLIDESRHVIFDYDDPRAKFIQPMKGDLINAYMLNRTDSITSLYMAIVMQSPMLLAPSWDEFGEFLEDFLHMKRVLLENSKGGREFKYQRHASKTDDVVHVTNLAYTLIRLAGNSMLITDPATRTIMRDIIYGGGAANGFVGNPWASALSSYARGGEYDE